jgi:hypothetical protein
MTSPSHKGATSTIENPPRPQNESIGEFPDCTLPVHNQPTEINQNSLNRSHAGNNSTPNRAAQRNNKNSTSFRHNQIKQDGEAPRFNTSKKSLQRTEQLRMAARIIFFWALRSYGRSKNIDRHPNTCKAIFYQPSYQEAIPCRVGLRKACTYIKQNDNTER